MISTADVKRRDPEVEIGSRFVLARNGTPVALTGGHGQSYDALTPLV